MPNKTSKLIVSDINKSLFVIPFFQRGYRWTGRNVKQLLSDLLLFANNADESEYCLQPIVLQKISKSEYSSLLNDEEHVVRVVDGQQRLTTIAIVLHKLGIKTTWDIYYDSEKKRLSQILNETSDLISINDYFRKEVSDAIDEWFAGHKKQESEVSVQQLLSSIFQSQGKKIAFLEYEIETPTCEDSEKEGHKAFLRLNDGKTPLTSSELIRALYMVQGSGLTIQQQMEISKEWELIETSLQNEQFWLMFNARGLEDTPTRIDLLFALVLSVSLKETKANPRIIFEKLDDEDEQFDLEKVWEEVLRTFWWMQSCFSDIELCNYLCWIRTYTDISTSTIYGYWRKYPSHEAFKNRIIKEIQNISFGGTRISVLDDVDYNWDKGELRKLFVLLNVLDCNKSQERFRFDLFNQCKGWDIEHIDSQTPNDFKQDKNKEEWLKMAYNELTKKQKQEFVENFIEHAVELEVFNIHNLELDNFDVYAEYIVQLSKDTEDAISQVDSNKLGNLALLNLSINRSYKNDIFPLKRKAIIDHVNSGSEFIPPCTIKAFTKFYTKSASRITSWQNADYNDYYQVMDSRFREFMAYDTNISDDVEMPYITNLRKEAVDTWSLLNTKQSKEEIELQEKDRCSDPISFPEFMDKYNVVIPKIQRLYVQGRLDKRGAKCLSGFASSLVDGVLNSTSLLLDFIYGIDTKHHKYTFYPLDGQQRLTTLLLLSWLCGLSKPDWSFKYESRRTTEEFIKRLLEETPPQLIKPDDYNYLKKKANETNKDYPSLCSEYIYNLPWFHKSWLCDPGISGMIEMLDSLLDKLLNTSTEQTLKMDSIVFLLNYLDVSTKSYDQIFLKMNSRGRELTEWDNVNTILDEFLPNNLKDIWPEKIQKWYELMWYKTALQGTRDTQKIDKVDAQMLYVVELALSCSGYSDKITNTYQLSNWLKNNNDEVANFYRLCSIFFSALEIDEQASCAYLIPKWTKSNRPRIPDFAYRGNEVIQKFYQPLLVYYAAQLSTNEEWIRVIWNLVVNINIDKDSFRQAVKLIDELSQGKESILLFLSELKISDIKSSYSNANLQLQEEIDKAQQIINQSSVCPTDWNESIGGPWKGWYDIIVAAESKRYFAGAIRFLFHDGDNNIKWSTFCTKWFNANLYFDDYGIKDIYAASLVAALLKRCNRWEQIHDRFIFDKNNWKVPVLLNELYAEALDYILESNSLDVEVVNFEEGKICERIIRDRLYEDKFIKIIVSQYSNYRISWGRYFYGWKKHDGILLDWRTDNDVPEAWELRRNTQIQDMLSISDEIRVLNTHITDEIYFGNTIRFEYKLTLFKWSDNNRISWVGNEQREQSLEVSPNMNGLAILKSLSEKLEA